MKRILISLIFIVMFSNLVNADVSSNMVVGLEKSIKDQIQNEGEITREEIRSYKTDAENMINDIKSTVRNSLKMFLICQIVMIILALSLFEMIKSRVRKKRKQIEDIKNG